MGYEENFWGNKSPASDWLCWKPAVDDEMQRHLMNARADASKALWALADYSIPPDVKETAALWGMKETLLEIWRGAFIAGWRAAHKVPDVR